MLPPDIIEVVPNLTVSDIGARRTQPERLRDVVDASIDWIVLAKADTSIVFSSRASTALLGYQPEELAGHLLVNLVHPDDRAEFSAAVRHLPEDKPVQIIHRFQCRNGTPIRVESVLQRSAPGRAAIALAARDVHWRRELRNELMQPAAHDPVTGLANRAQIERELGRAISRADAGSLLGLISINIDAFSELTASLGEPDNDALLRTICKRLARLVRRGDVAGRFGSHQFAVICSSQSDEGGLIEMAQAIRTGLSRRPYTVAGKQAAITVSVGVSLWRPNVTAGQLLMEADSALRVSHHN